MIANNIQEDLFPPTLHRSISPVGDLPRINSPLVWGNTNNYLGLRGTSDQSGSIPRIRETFYSIQVFREGFKNVPSNSSKFRFF